MDLTVVALRKTIYRDSPLPHERPEGNILTEVIGTIGNFFRNLLNHTVHRKQPVQRDYVHYFAVKREELRKQCGHRPKPFVCTFASVHRIYADAVLSDLVVKLFHVQSQSSTFISAP